MSARYSRFLLPVAFLALAVFAYVQLGDVAASDVGAGVGNDLRRLFGGQEQPTHPVLGWTLLITLVLSSICALASAWWSVRGLRHERRP